MQYEIQKGDPIGKITEMLGVSWKEFKKLNPHAVSRSKSSGREYIKAGQTVTGPGSSFQAELKGAQAEQKGDPTSLQSSSGQWMEYSVQAGDTIWKLAREKFHVPVDAIMKDNGIVNPRTLQIGQILRIRTAAPPGEAAKTSIPEETVAAGPPPGQQTVVASWYGKPYHGRPMSNGKIYDMYQNTIAHRDLPLGTLVELENPATGKVVEATVTDRGPFIDGRDVDLSYGLAEKLSLVKKGVGKLLMKIR